MKNLVSASLSALALLGLAACSDSGKDGAATQSTSSANQEKAAPDGGGSVDNNTEIIAPRPQSGTGGDMPTKGADPVAPAPAN